MSLWQSVDEQFKCSNPARAVRELEEFLSQHEAGKFKCLVGAQFSNSPNSVLDTLDGFVEANSRKFEVRSVYAEMNGFDINYDRWYFDLFAYSSYLPEYDDTEWLCNWQSDGWPEVELLGMENAREAFAWYHEQRIWKSQPQLKPAYEAAMLLVMSKFAVFVGSALQAGPLSRAVPVLASAHDFESVARYVP